MSDAKASTWLLLLQLVRFGIVGVLAAIVHFLVANTLAAHTGIHVAYTNIVGFLCAFWVSFFGHHFFSFQANHLSLTQTLPKFALVALLGFFSNESLLLLFKLLLALPNAPALILAIVLSAMLSFALNRYFAFY